MFFPIALNWSCIKKKTFCLRLGWISLIQEQLYWGVFNMQLWCCASHSFSSVLRKDSWFSSFPTCSFVYGRDLEASTCPFLLSLSWSVVSVSSFGALQCLIFWQVKLTGQKWEKSVLFCRTAAFCWDVCFYRMASHCYTRHVVFVLWILHWACLILLVIIYATKHCGGVLGRSGKLHSCKIGVAFRFFNTDFFCKLLQQ